MSGSDAPDTADAASGGDSTAEPEKRVSWAELFDLVFVFAVTEVSTLLERDRSWGGLLRALIVFVPIYWMWVGTAIQTNLRDIAQPRLRLKVFAVALAAVFMAVAAPDAYGSLGLLFAAAYWAGRVVLGVDLLRRSARGTTMPVNPYTISMFLTGPLLVVGAPLHGSAREGIWAAAAAIDLATPTLLRSRLRNMHLNAAHLAERFGLFVLIALGESVVAIGESAHVDGHLGAARGFAVAAAFALSCGLWWVYFQFAADAVRHSLATAAVQLDITRMSYGHLLFIAAIIAAAVGMHDAVIAPADHLEWGAAGLLYGGTALYLASFGFTRWAMFGLVSRTRLTTAAVVLVLLPTAPHLPALADLFALAIVLAVLNTYELTTAGRTGWRARLLGREAHGQEVPSP